MINQKYYEDIKSFPSQFQKGYELAKVIGNIEGNFTDVVICGMGGSSLYVEMLNSYFATFTKFRLSVIRGYDIPSYYDSNTLFIISSHSGNTEETISCLNQAIQRNLKCVVFAAGGKLLEIAMDKSLQVFDLPAHVQPRLATGYFIAGVLSILIQKERIEDKSEDFINAFSKLDENLDEEKAKDLAMKLKDKVPVIYSTDNMSGIARICKINFNENTKTQSFFNEFPELNHNEMVGFTNLVMNPYFVILQSKFSNKRNDVRIDTFTKLMKEQDVNSFVYELPGNNLLQEMLSAYYFIYHVSYYLAEAYGVDPEPVEMVEKFKKLID